MNNADLLKILQSRVHLPEMYEHLLRGEIDVFVVATGAGAGIQKHLWAPPGASAFLIGSALTYWPQETDAFLGFRPRGYCSDDTAIDLAMEAYVRAKKRNFAASYTPRPAIGLSVTASVASKVAHRGEHRVHLAVVSDNGAWKTSYTLEKGVGEEARALDEEICTYAALDLLEVAFGLDFKASNVEHQHISDAELRERVLRRPYFTASRRGNFAHDTRGGFAYFPGSFNPIQAAHRYMAQNVVDRLIAHKSLYTICVDHKHKPPLAALDILGRVASFRVEHLPAADSDILTPEPHLLFTAGDPLFVDKMLARRNAKWIMGADVLQRMLDPKWGLDPLIVVKTIQETDSHLVVFDCMHEGQRLTVDRALLTHIPNWKSYLNAARHITQISDSDLPDTRSTQVRAEAAARAAAGA